jgi:NAD(P)-dependent dehydrogenase (short-subunit alcohol dehydrogenase family)
MTENAPTIQQLFDLRGKVALITGGTGYLGSALAAALAEAGARVVVASRDLEKARAAAAALGGPAAGEHRAVVIDHMDEASIAAGFAAAVRETGQVDVLVNNGHEAVAADWTTLTGQQFARQLANATGYFLLARELRNHLVSRQSAGNVVMLGSMYGLVGSYPDVYETEGPANSAAYQVLKGGIAQLTRHLAVYWGRDQVRVNCLSPGPFPGPAVSRDLTARLEAKSPLRRMGRAHELKGALLLLASEAGSYITGHNLVIDGGWTAW